MSVMRIRYEQSGAHIHCRVFTAPAPDQTYAKSGDLYFSLREWKDIQQMFRNAEWINEGER